MSNASIITRVREEIAAFERKERTADQMERVLAAHFEALEGLSYSKLTALRDFEHRLVKAQVADEDPRFDSSEVVVAQLRAMLDAIETEANPQGGANRRQPGGSESDTTPSAAASGRSP